jgi:four helix bundle protein
MLAEHLRMIGQMEAAVSSIAQNIAEGKGRQYKKEFVQFLYIAEGSLFEVLALCELFQRRKLFSDAEATRIRALAENLDRKLRGLANSLKERSTRKAIRSGAAREGRPAWSRGACASAALEQTMTGGVCISFCLKARSTRSQARDLFAERLKPNALTPAVSEPESSTSQSSKVSTARH